MVAKHFKDYSLGKPFAMQTDRNPLSHTMAVQDLDANGPHWDELLAQYTFGIGCLERHEDTVAKVLRVIAIRFHAELVLYDVNGCMICWEDAHDPPVFQAGDGIDKCIQVKAV